MSKFSLTLCSTLLLAGLTLPAWANPSDISGMTTFGPKALITVSDCKTKSEKPRLHILNVQPDKGPKYLPITVPVWQDSEKGEVQRASDLEAICKVPEAPGRFYAFESGYWKGGGGRAFELEITHDPVIGWVGRVVNIIRPFKAPADGTTVDHQQIEGCAAFRDGAHHTYFLLGLRGDSEHEGQLVVSRLEEDGQCVELERRPIDLRGFLGGGRSCSDLCLQSYDTNIFHILSSGVIDGGDLGPFKSVIADVGTLEIKADGYELYVPKKASVVYTLDGLKVEAISHYLNSKKAHLCVGTDDEEYDAVFRLLPIKQQ